MTDGIDRDALIKGLREHQKLACTGEILDADEVTEILTMHDENAALRARVAELEGAGWQPIETAPKDGVRVLAYIPKYGPTTAHLEMYGPDAGRKWHCHSCLNKEAQPTHWRPLPATEGI